MSNSARRLHERERRGPCQALKLVVAYDGRGFAGSQRQAGKRTAQGELERAVAAVFGIPTPVYLAGRTDAGVHAVGQVASLADYRPDLDDRTVLRALNAHLPGDLAVQSVERRPLGFHARYSAHWREYRYRLWTGVRQPLVSGYVWQRPEPLAVSAMAEAAARLVGTHDLASFAGGGEGVPWSERSQRARGTVRTILVCDVGRLAPWWGVPVGEGELVEIRVAADGFLPRMVRGIVGALVEIGRGARPATWIDDLLVGRDRRFGPINAPSHGLTLWRVGYSGDDSRNE